MIFAYCLGSSATLNTGEQIESKVASRSLQHLYTMKQMTKKVENKKVI